MEGGAPGPVHSPLRGRLTAVPAADDRAHSGSDGDDDALFGLQEGEDDDEGGGRSGGVPASELEATAWLVLVVDDEEAVHDVTRLVLRGLEFEGRPLTLLHARTAREAQALLQA